MSVATTRPDAVPDDGGTTWVGAASRLVALNDDLPTSYVVFAHGQHPIFGFAEPSIPAGAKVKAGRLRAQLRRAAPAEKPLQFNWHMNDPTGGANIYGSAPNQSVPWSTMTTSTVLDDVRTGPHVAPTSITADVYAHSDDPSHANLVHVAALYFDTIYVVKPVVTVTSPTATLTGDTTPPVLWTSALDGAGGTQTAFQVKFFTSAQANPTAASSSNESGIITGGATSWTPTLPLADGNWFVYVRVAQTVNGETHWSDWGSGTAGSFSGFTVSIARPATPSMTLTSEPLSARIKVLLTSIAGAATTSLFQTQFSDDAGATWQNLRTSDGGGLSTPAGGASTVYDYETPNGGTRSFRARALHSYQEGDAVSAWTATQTATWTSTDWWLKHPGQSALNLTLIPQSQPTSTRAARAGKFNPLGARYPVVVSDVRSAAEGEIVFLVESDADRDKLDALLATGDPILIQAPPGIVDWPDRWCSIQDYLRERIVDKSWVPFTSDTLPWVEVARP